MKNSLDKNGLSLSQAQSVSNICYQKAIDITNGLSVINNYSRSVNVNGTDYVETTGNKLPNNVVELVSLKAKYHATQAFLMENIKAKDALLQTLRNKHLNWTVEAPKVGVMAEYNLLNEVGEDWGKEQLSIEEINELLLNEAQAAHLGQFIHKGSKLDQLRNELPTLKTLEWMEVEAGKKSPVKVTPHHTQDQLGKLYEEFSALHRKAEQRVNYFKAKIKNLVTAENARIAELNSAEMTRVNVLNEATREVYTNATKAWREAYQVAQSEFEAKRNKEIQEAAALRIKVSPLFAETVNEILATLEVEE